MRLPAMQTSTKTTNKVMFYFYCTLSLFIFSGYFCNVFAYFIAVFFCTVIIVLWVLLIQIN